MFQLSELSNHRIFVMRRYCIIAMFACILFSSCQTVNTILANPDYNLLDLARTKKSFTLNEPFPEKGYTLQGMHYRNIEVQRFTDNDTFYYIKYNPTREERNFYFTVIDKQTVDTILVNSLDKKKTASVYQRENWLDNALVKLGIKELNKNDGLWTYFAPKYKMVRGNLPTDRVRTGYHREYEKFSYNTAMTKYYEQRHPQHKLTAIEALGALYIINMLSNSNTGNTRYFCRSCGLSFSNAGDLRSHENAVHDY